MDARAALAERFLQSLPELVPRDRVGAAELEGPVARFRLVERGGEIGGDVVGPDRLDLLLAGADDRRHGRHLCELSEGGQDPTLAREDEARPEDHVLEAGLLDRLLLGPLGVEVGDEILRVLARAERAHQDEALDAGVLGRGDEVAGALLHDPLELVRRALPDRDEVDDRVDAFDGRLQARAVRHLAHARLPGKVARARRVADEQLQIVTLVRQCADDVRADEAGPPGDENLHLTVWFASKFCQYRLGVGPIWPWYLEPSSPVP